jgi:hypothetical protein
VKANLSRNSCQDHMSNTCVATSKQSPSIQSDAEPEIASLSYVSHRYQSLHPSIYLPKNVSSSNVASQHGQISPRRVSRLRPQNAVMPQLRFSRCVPMSQIILLNYSLCQRDDEADRFGIRRFISGNSNGPTNMSE